MHDIHAAVAALNATKSYAALGNSAVFQNFVKPVEAKLAVGIVGALLDQLIWLSGEADSEMDTLRAADSIWTRLLTVCDKLRSARTLLEAGVANPDDFATAKAAIGAAAGLRDELLPQIGVLASDVAKFGQELEDKDFIPPLAQSLDAPVATWPPSDLFAGRRTGALRVALLSSASGPQEARSFALGSLSAYVTRRAVGEYRKAVVGGPPRNHRYRSRLASRTIGAWLRKHRPDITPSLADLAAVLRSEVGEALPSHLHEAFAKAWDETYGSYVSQSAPDLPVGYVVLLEQLDILSRLSLAGPNGNASPGSPASGLTAPAPVSPGAATGATAPGVEPLGSGADGGAGGWGGAKSPGKVKVKAKGKFSWKTLLAVLVTIALGVAATFIPPPGAWTALGVLAGVGFGAAIGAWKVDEAEVSAGGTYSQALSSDEAAVLCQELYDLDVKLFTIATTLLQTLKSGGLAYADPFDLASYPFSQFTSVSGQLTTMRRPMFDPFDHLIPPTSAIELPIADAVGFGRGSNPNDLIGGLEQDKVPTAVYGGIELWRAAAFIDSEPLRKVNLQLDVDRRFGSRCWTGKVTSNPVQTSSLAYDAV